MATSAKNTGTARSTSVKPAAAKPVPAAAPAGAKPVVKPTYVKVSIKGKDGKVTRVSMEKSKALGLAKKRAGARGTAAVGASLKQTTDMIPSAYKDYVDPASIDASVNAAIAAKNDPLDTLKQNATTQAASNAQAAASLGLQSQATMDQLMANANARTQGFQQLAGQGIAAEQQTNQAAAAAISHALGGALNPMVGQMTDAGLAPLHATQNAQGVQNVWAQTLASGAQSDYFQRGKALAALTAQNFTQKQQEQLGLVLNKLSAEQQANIASRPDLVSKAAQEQATFGIQSITAQALADQKASDTATKQYDSVTKRKAVNVSKYNATQARAAAATKAQAAADAKAAGTTAKAVDDIHKELSKRYEKATSGTTNVSVPITDAKGNKLYRLPASAGGGTTTDPTKGGTPMTRTETHTYSEAGLFPGPGGAIGEATRQLIGKGYDPVTAVKQAASWFPASIPSLKVADLVQLGVDGPTISQLVGNSAPSTSHQAAAADAAASKAQAALKLGATKTQAYLSGLAPSEVRKGMTISAAGVKFKVTHVDEHHQDTIINGRPVRQYSMTVKFRDPSGKTYKFTVRG